MVKVNSFTDMKFIWITMFSLFAAIATAQNKPQESPITEKESSLFSSDSLVGLAKSLLGIPYQYGGRTPAGFDCSGFVNYVFSNFGIELPRSSPELAMVGMEIPIDSCRKGDIILFAGSNKATRPVGHAGIVITEGSEPLKFIHSATSNHRGIVITALDAFDYYKTRFVKVVRVLDAINRTPE
jgi:murein DD-endopeptidase / murein LD-carboxypeptidase